MGVGSNALTRRAAVDAPRVAARSLGRSPVRGRRVSPSAAAGSALTMLLLLAAIAGPSLVPVDPAHQSLLARLAPPVGFGGSWQHPLGTDVLGRDLLARMVAGARISLLVGVVATAFAGAIGVALGVLAGVAGRRLDRIVTWAVDVQMAVPFVVVAIGLTATLGHGIGTVLATLALTGWVGYARIVRLQTRSLVRAPWVEAARAAGAGPARIALRHLLPNLSGPILVLASQQVAAMILYEAALSYLGLGIGGNVITWGGMVADGRETLLVAPWASIVPGGAIALAVLGFNLLGDASIDREQRRGGA